VPGFIVGNAEEDPSLVIVELGTAGVLLVFFPRVTGEVMYVDVGATM